MDNPDASGLEKLGLQMQGGELQRLAPGSSSDEQISMLNNIIDHLNNMLKVQIYSDSGSKRFVQGYAEGRWPGGDFGIAISKEGEDVLKARFEDLIFAWDFSTNIQYVRGGGQEFYEGKLRYFGGTQYYYRKDSKSNVGQIGLLPNDVMGQAWAKDGETIDGAITNGG